MFFLNSKIKISYLASYSPMNNIRNAKKTNTKNTNTYNGHKFK